jgi:LytS/YehU family sensor histidine kinase
LYLEIEKMRFGNSFEYKINVDESIDEEFIEIPSLLIQPFVENSIWHGLMLKAENRKIDISFEVKIENILLVTIYDNGIGRKKAAEIKSKQIKAQDHQSKGMKLSQERLEIIQHQTNQIASIEIEDLVDEYDQALGTKVLITLPILN